MAREQYGKLSGFESSNLSPCNLSNLLEYILYSYTFYAVEGAHIA